MNLDARQILEHTFDALAAPVLALGASDDRVFYPYLLTSAVLAVAVWWFKLRKRISLPTFLFPKKIWLHPSALFDLRFMAARALIGALFFAPLVLSSAHLAVWLRLHLSDAFSVPWTAPAGLALGAVSLSAFLFEDLARYGLHRLSHRVPALWELHKVHHSAEVLTPFTIYRTHPLEGLLMRTGSALGIALGAACAAWLLGAPLTVWEVIGVQGLSLAWNLTGANLRHSHVWIRYPSWLERILISPAQHQIHHSKNKRHFDRNFGSAFALWDWIFGSLYVTTIRERLTFGLHEEDKNHSESIISALFSPIASATRALLPSRALPQPKKLPIPAEASYHSARP